MKMKNKWVAVVVIILALGVIGTLVVPSTFTEAPVVIPPEPLVAPRNDIADSEIATSTNADPYADLIVVSSPSKGATVTSPLTIKGKARGSWYFEASFPIALVDLKTGLNIAEGKAEAQGNWQTDAFVPFIATLTFTTLPTSTSAMLVLRNDNPSGLPENDKSVSIPVVVK